MTISLLSAREQFSSVMKWPSGDFGLIIFPMRWPLNELFKRHAYTEAQLNARHLSIWSFPYMVGLLRQNYNIIIILLCMFHSHHVGFSQEKFPERDSYIFGRVIINFYESSFLCRKTRKEKILKSGVVYLHVNCKSYLYVYQCAETSLRLNAYMSAKFDCIKMCTWNAACTYMYRTTSRFGI